MLEISSYSDHNTEPLLAAAAYLRFRSEVMISNSPLQSKLDQISNIM